MIDFFTAHTQRILKYTAIVAILFFVIVIGLYFINFHAGLSVENGDWGTFGDFIGGTLNPIFSLLALTALLTTIALQSKEMELTRKELERAATAQERTEYVLNEQSRTLALQKFEGTFFALLDQHNKILENLSAPNSKNVERISEIELIAMQIFESYPNTTLGLHQSKNTLMSKSRICGHYFRILYQLLKFIATNTPGSVIDSDFSNSAIENSPLAQNEKMYSNIVRSFLNTQFTQILAINCFCENKEDDIYWKFKLLIERFEFLEHMPFVTHIGDRIIKPAALKESFTYYNKKAFGKNNFLNQID